MKKIIKPVVFLLSMVLIVSGGPVWAAQFLEFGGGFTTAAQATTGGFTDGPYQNSDYVSSYTSATTDPTMSGIGASATGRAWYYYSTGSVEVLAESYVAASSTGSDHHASANAGTLMPVESTGFYFEIVPESGETVGSPVKIDFSWNACSFFSYYSTSGSAMSAQTIFSGSNGGDIAITINDNPAVSGYDPARAVWTHPELILSYDEPGTTVDSFFMANIGDVIGIHIGSQAMIDLWGEGDLSAHAINDMMLSIARYRCPPLFGFLPPGF